MYLRPISLIAFVVGMTTMISTKGKAQISEPYSYHAFVDLWRLGGGVELKLTKNTTFLAKIAAEPYFRSYSTPTGRKNLIGFAPSATANFRWYFNYLKRIEEGKRTVGFAASYLAAHASWSLNRKIIASGGALFLPLDFYTINIGLKRNIGKAQRWFFDLAIGAGIKHSFRETDGQVYPSPYGYWTFGFRF